MTATATLVAPKAPRSVRRAPAGSKRSTGVVVGFVALLLIGLMLAPVVFIILGGFRSNAEITVDPSGLPTTWNWQNYADVLTSGVFWGQVGNSAIAAIATTLFVVALGLMAAYGLSRYRFRGRGAVFALFTAGLMFPMTVAITPLYILVRNLGLMNSLAGVIVPQIAFALPLTIIILSPFLSAIPRELQEAASIDGLGRLGFFWRMVLPLAVPAVVTVGILAFVNSWNSYMLPLFILNNEAAYTLPLGTQAFASQYSVDTARVLAFTSLSMIPALLFFSVFERRIVGGLTGAVKG
ncbi:MULTISPECIES: carbohydrate ABC transporter permease [Microbacterium]|uniref:Sugar ABC transporter permease n=1 Tax=Microbacterium testaceum TaxID=2033 RepID=A0A4Y3QNM5_MICTE|nr:MULTISPECIES: carbohydrate ABC transporter permease [Microbacterium]MDZ5146047.1 carbohydrate ABC transporter permease [Microbacterium testaceum]PNW10236.1 thiamine ABC transporter ATP-binding protein [Microbacterium testaceum]REC98820.1 carbohydrate ABC transporter membrane protein 2 (CUT1 family) [Microbacterium sp. AG157]GEB46263.1 sugar ABC transporter permease [Microbacterium testaceum]